MFIFKNLNIFILFIVICLFSSCSFILQDHKDDYLKEEQTEVLKVPLDKNVRQTFDYYPVPPEGLKELAMDTYEVPLPQQFFSSGSSSEIRLHKLGELRWLYVESLPSSVWPMMKDFWSTSKYGLDYEDPNLGVIDSQVVKIGNTNTKLRMKIEHGIRQSSSELFIYHLVKENSDSWVRVPGEDNLEDVVLRSVMDFLSRSSSSQGTSLVALNLNLGQKATLKQKEDGSSFIEMSLEYPRAWAAVDRALKEAIITVTDLDRKNGVFYVVFSQKEEKGFFRRLISLDESDLNKNFKIYVKMEGSKCIVTVKGDKPDSASFERELLSQINQSLS